jgi:hypothetical protein
MTLIDGTVQNSTLTLIVYCVATGTLTTFYIYYANGFFIASTIMLVGIVLSAVSAWMLCECTAHCNARTIEEIAY